jgi:protein-tyrosine-phosphatase
LVDTIVSTEISAPDLVAALYADYGGWGSAIPCHDPRRATPGLKRDDWPLPDPQGKDIGEVRRIRDEIRKRVGHLLQTI